MDILSILALATQCATAAPAPVVAALAMTESNGSAYSVVIDGKRSDHAGQDEAVQSVALAQVEGSAVKIGIASVPVKAFDALNVSYTEGFSACYNLEVAGEELRTRWESFGGQDEHWRLAVLDYATGEPGVDGDYGQRYDAALAEIKGQSGHVAKRSGAPAKAVASTTAPAQATASDNGRKAVGSGAQWDVFNRAPSQSLLVFSR